MFEKVFDEAARAPSALIKEGSSTKNLWHDGPKKSETKGPSVTKVYTQRLKEVFYRPHALLQWLRDFVPYDFDTNEQVYKEHAPEKVSGVADILKRSKGKVHCSRRFRERGCNSSDTQLIHFCYRRSIIYMFAFVKSMEWHPRANSMENLRPPHRMRFSQTKQQCDSHITKVCGFVFFFLLSLFSFIRPQCGSFLWPKKRSQPHWHPQMMATRSGQSPVKPAKNRSVAICFVRYVC